MTEHDVARFGDAVEHVLGLHHDASKLTFLEEVLHRRLAATRLGIDAYLDEIHTLAPSSAELNALAAELTVGETYFLRNVEQFDALTDEVLPRRRRARQGAPLRVLSAGCSTGEEPYSIAITLQGRDGDAPQATIIGADIDAAALDRARRAKYSAWALRGTPQAVRERWFTPDGRDFALAEPIISAVTFVHDNLATNSKLWVPDSYDIVFCRNVMMYFGPDQARNLVERITRSIVPGGYLFLGHAETLRGLSTNFHLCHSHGTFYYQRKGTSEAASDQIAAAPDRLHADELLVGTLATSVVDSVSWVDAIRLASERVQALTSTGAAPARTTAPRRWNLTEPFVLLQQERFAEALDHVDALPPDAADDPDVALLLAVLLAHNGMFERAEAACRQLLRVDDLSAGAHYVMALCREGVGDVAGAIRHDHIAVYLDPGFAMARMHLGLLARRRNDAETSRRELSYAITLLQHEDSSRTLLFGGGFSRDSLIAMCRSQLASVGAS